MIVRAARPGEAAALSDLALRSKGHWGYSREFLEACRAELTLREDELVARRVVVAEDDGSAVGFYSLDGEPPDGELGNLFVDPAWIGRGVGRLLWDHLRARAAGLGFGTLRIEADPQAASFYEAMGAEPSGSVPSGSLPGRRLPVLTYRIGASALP